MEKTTENGERQTKMSDQSILRILAEVQFVLLIIVGFITMVTISSDEPLVKIGVLIGFAFAGTTTRFALICIANIADDLKAIKNKM